MSSDNLSSAGNQQERLSSEEQQSWFLAGIVEGEGSVTVGIKRHPTQRLGYYFQPEFFIYQHHTRKALLEMAQEYFGTGRIKPSQAIRTFSCSPSSLEYRLPLAWSRSYATTCGT